MIKRILVGIALLAVLGTWLLPQNILEIPLPFDMKIYSVLILLAVIPLISLTINGMIHMFGGCN